MGYSILGPELPRVQFWFEWESNPVVNPNSILGMLMKEKSNGRPSSSN